MGFEPPILGSLHNPLYLLSRSHLWHCNAFFPLICCYLFTSGPWRWGWGEAVERPDHGAGHKVSRRLPDCSEYHDLNAHAQSCLHRRCHREGAAVHKVSPSEHAVPTVWPSLQGRPTWRWVPAKEQFHFLIWVNSENKVAKKGLFIICANWPQSLCSLLIQLLFMLCVIVSF